MFNITPSETFKEEVKVHVKTESGLWRQESYTAEFKRTPEDDRQRLQALPYAQLVEEVLVGWDMVDLQRNPVPFSPATKAAFLTHVAGVRETAMVYFKANAGIKEKN